VAETKESAFRRLLKNLSYKSRTKKFELLQRVFRAQPEDRVLDVGASGEVFLSYALEDVYPYPGRIVAAGREAREILAARQHYPQPRYVLLDGCELPFPDQSFDLVFSNAVVEHILGPGRQEKFAQEVRRVGKSWFVTTPNYWYPFESHHHLPFFQFLPPPVQMVYNRWLGTHVPQGTVQDLALLSARQLQALFPTGRIAKVRVTFWPETLVAYYLHPERAGSGAGASSRGAG
jgi:ubiquinone/menaquinone biosynthesis C-methylase UbiE